MTAAPETEFPLKDWVPETRTLLIGDREVEPAGDTWDVYNPATDRKSVV